MSYNYRVRDPLGNIHEGRVEAASVDAATQQLRPERPGGALCLDDESDDAGLLPRRITKSDVIYTTNQLAVMVDTGITLSAALNGMVEQEENPTLRKVLADLKSSVEQGDDFSSALARYPRLFDRTYVSLVKASEATGSLGEMLERVASYLRKEMENRAKVRAALAYPTVMLVLATGVTIFLVTFILPKFTPLFNRPGMKLPKPTVVLMTISHYLIDYWYAWVIGGVAAAVGFLYGRRTPVGRQVLDWIRIHTPIIGPMYRKVAISRSVRTLGTMIGSGVPLLESLRLAGEVSGNIYYERLWQEVQNEVTTGNQIYEALARNRLFPRMLVQMIRAGEETGRLDEVLAKLSNYYDQEVETSLKSVTSMIEPIMITVMGVVVGGIGLALMLPIFSLSSHPHWSRRTARNMGAPETLVLCHSLILGSCATGSVSVFFGNGWVGEALAEPVAPQFLVVTKRLGTLTWRQIGHAYRLAEGRHKLFGGDVVGVFEGFLARSSLPSCR